MRLILASASPRRRALLEQAGIDFTVVVPDPAIEEVAATAGDPHATAIENARRKAQAVPGEAVLGADTVVALGDRLLGKPADAAHARALLEALSGTSHRVVTGLALALHGRVRVSSVETKVTMRRLEDAEIEAYAASAEGMGKAGGYAIQEHADRFVTRIEGPFDNVVGLPLDALRSLMRKVGL